MTIQEFAKNLDCQGNLSPLQEGLQALRACDPEEFRKMNQSSEGWPEWPASGETLSQEGERQA